MAVSTVIKSIQDIMRKDAGVDGDAQRIGQVAWLLFLKIFDSQEEELELMQGDEYEAPIPKEYLWRNWAADKEGITGDAMLDFINNKLFPDLKNLQLCRKRSLQRCLQLHEKWHPVTAGGEQAG